MDEYRTLAELGRQAASALADPRAASPSVASVRSLVVPSWIGQMVGRVVDFTARLRDAGRPFSRQASIAKLVATDNAMKVTTDAVQVLGGAGYTRDFPVERYMRETKVMQIFEGTNQIQRMVIARTLARQDSATVTTQRKDS